MTRDSARPGPPTLLSCLTPTERISVPYSTAQEHTPFCRDQFEHARSTGPVIMEDEITAWGSRAHGPLRIALDGEWTLPGPPLIETKGYGKRAVRANRTTDDRNLNRPEHWVRRTSRALKGRSARRDGYPATHRPVARKMSRRENGFEAVAAGRWRGPPMQIRSRAAKSSTPIIPASPQNARR